MAGMMRCCLPSLLPANALWRLLPPARRRLPPAVVSSGYMRGSGLQSPSLGGFAQSGQLGLCRHSAALVVAC
jgi:hypothetical protein